MGRLGSIRATMVVALVCVVSCKPAAPWERLEPAPACPRESHRNADGRCSCNEALTALLGACVPPRVADDFCAPAARGGPDGCVFRSCGPDERLDVASGACVNVDREAIVLCPDEGSASLLDEGTVACVPLDATCPRGAQRVGRECRRGPSCGAGSVWDGEVCRAFVHEEQDGRTAVDVPLWISLVLGRTAGPGTPVLCRPLQQRPRLYSGPHARVHLSVALSLPEGDLAAMTAAVEVEPREGKGLSHAATEWAERAAETLTEVLRCVGGSGRVSRLDTDVWCEVAAR